MNNQIKIDFDTKEEGSVISQERGLALIRKGIIERAYTNVIKKYGAITEASLTEFDMKWGINLYREKDDAEEIVRWINEFSKTEIVVVVDAGNDSAGKLYKIKLLSSISYGIR